MTDSFTDPNTGEHVVIASDKRNGAWLKFESDISTARDTSSNGMLPIPVARNLGLIDIRLSFYPPYCYP